MWTHELVVIGVWTSQYTKVVWAAMSFQIDGEEQTTTDVPLVDDLIGARVGGRFRLVDMQKTL